MPASTQAFGPFVHGLNKGGLFNISGTRKLRGANPSNNMASERPAVRAYAGSFEHQKAIKRWSGSDKTFIEFMTYTPPRSGLPPGYAEWSEEQLNEGFLPIHILRIVDGNGRQIPAVEYANR